MNETSEVLLAMTIDKYIYMLIKNEFHNRYVLLDASLEQCIEAYKKYGIHNIDFTKIYD